MNAYEQKQQDRKDRLEQRAQAAKTNAASLIDRAHSMASVIPFGQPIHVGHHSERSDRGYRARIHNTFGKGFEELKKSEYYEQKAASVGTGGISSDDPDAITKLQEQLDMLIRSQDLMKSANTIIRKHTGDADAQVAALVAAGFTETEARDAVTPDFAGRIGYASYKLSNNNANIKRVRDRIKQLESVADRVTVEVESEGYTYREDIEENRIMFIFEGKPDDFTRGLLKRHAFKWSPSRGAWVRQLTGNAQYAAKTIKDSLAAESSISG